MALRGLVWSCCCFLRPSTSLALCGFVWSCVALCGLVWPFVASLWPLYGLFMASFWPLYGLFMVFYGKISSFLAVIDPNSFGLVSVQNRLEKSAKTVDLSENRGDPSRSNIFSL